MASWLLANLMLITWLDESVSVLKKQSLSEREAGRSQEQGKFTSFLEGVESVVLWTHWWSWRQLTLICSSSRGGCSSVSLSCDCKGMELSSTWSQLTGHACFDHLQDMPALIVKIKSYWHVVLQNQDTSGWSWAKLKIIWFLLLPWGEEKLFSPLPFQGLGWDTLYKKRDWQVLTNRSLTACMPL